MYKERKNRSHTGNVIWLKDYKKKRSSNGSRLQKLQILTRNLNTDLEILLEK
jgi:hypothetical protein